ncbi:hypothetical protein JCM11641_007624 [Rhodosporidiobolus odoratus]
MDPISRVDSPRSLHFGPSSSTPTSSSYHSTLSDSGSTPRSVTPLHNYHQPLRSQTDMVEPQSGTQLGAAGAGPASGGGGLAPTRTPSGRARGPPMRSTTMDDHYYAGPGEASALTRGMAPPLPRAAEMAAYIPAGNGGNGNGQWGAIGQGYAPPLSRAPGLYNLSQGTYSSPSLNANPASSESAPPLPHDASQRISSSSASFSAFQDDPLVHSPGHPAALALPTTMDDLNIGLESMRFEQRSPSIAPPSHSQDPYAHQQQMQSRRYSPNDFSLPSSAGPDGAMEIRASRNGPGGERHQTTSVYSVDSQHAPSGGAGWQQGHGRSTSVASNRTFGYGGGMQGGVEGYAEEGASMQRPASSASFLPYDDAYGGPPQQQQYSGGGGGGDYFAGQGGQQQGYMSQQSPRGGEIGYFQPGQAGGYGGYPSGPPSSAGPYGQHPQQQPAFHPQPPHAGYGYDYRAAAAAQNPYYAAATGQLGLDPSQAQAGAGSGYGQLHRGMSSVSSLGVPASASGQGSMHSLSRSQSSLALPGGPLRRKATGASTMSAMSTSSTGPPITKASVDEYRQRIKADPDPEAQFNFAKYLIEAAKKINSSASGDEKAAKKYRDALLAESLKLIKRLATQGGGLGKPAYADAQFFLANCLGNGSLGLQIDHEKAYNLYVQASKQNHSAATYRTAVCNELGAGTRRDHARAVLFYRKASALGDTAGMYKLGMILLHGLLGQQRNPKEALAWLKRAASQADEDNPHALHELGLLYEKPPALVSSTTASLGAKAAAQLQQQHLQAGGPPPTIVPFDPIQARDFFTQAAQFGYPPSQFKLGCCYEFGTLTCPVEPRRSIAWYTRAAERGDSQAELALSGWYLTGSEGVLKQSDSEAYLWARRAANKGLAKAEYAVGYYSEVGIGVKADLEEAKRWYMRAAAQGNKRAMQRLTELKKLGSDKKGSAAGKGKVRPTRKDAETECVVM